MKQPSKGFVVVIAVLIMLSSLVLPVNTGYGPGGKPDEVGRRAPPVDLLEVICTAIHV